MKRNIKAQVFQTEAVNTVGTITKFVGYLVQNITAEDAAVMAEHTPDCIIFANQCFDSSTYKSKVNLTLLNNSIRVV